MDLSIVGPQETRSAGTDTLIDLENVTGSAGRDALVGTAEANVLTGGAGNDVLVASAGDDLLDGGTGADTVDYSARPPGVIATLVAGTGRSSGAVDVFVAVENLTGSPGDDVLSGDGNGNVLDGGDGDDRLRGLGGDDSVRRCGRRRPRRARRFRRPRRRPGADTADYASFYPVNLRTGVFVDLGAGTATGDGARLTRRDRERSGSAFDDTITGDGQPNILSGSDGRDTIAGGNGEDTVVGGLGADSLGGGGGNDLVLAHDGVIDTVDGGAGRDTAHVDRGDHVQNTEVVVP